MLGVYRFTFTPATPSSPSRRLQPKLAATGLPEVGHREDRTRRAAGTRGAAAAAAASSSYSSAPSAMEKLESLPLVTVKTASEHEEGASTVDEPRYER